MCGITGIYGENNRQLLNSMLKAIEHRGPDSRGTYLDSNVSLGVNRLSILDLDNGDQPISNEEGTVGTVFNGEIYNYKQLRNRLKNKGHNFSSNSDTEVIVHLYEEKGQKFVEDLRGMFSIAVWDSDRQKLILTRDRFGIKPLYYTTVSDSLLFSSEIKSFYQHPEFKPQLSKKSVKKFLRLRYIPGPATIFREVNKVEPGQQIICQLGERTESRYFSADPTVEQKPSDKGELKEKLEQTVSKRLMGDVPLGVFLSGGLDSTAIVNFAQKNKEKFTGTLKTYSLSFSQDKSDEKDYANYVADYYSTDHQTINFSGLEFETLQKIVWSLDEPMADPTVIPSYLLSQKAKEDCKVILTGEGADEVFGGYEQYRYMKLKSKYSRLAKLASHLLKLSGTGFLARVKRFLSEQDDLSSYLELVSIFDERELNAYFQVEDTSETLTNFESRELVSNMLNFDLEGWLVDNLLAKLDKTTMAHSIEGRVPFLDLDLYRAGSSLPYNSKINHSHKKYLLKKSLEQELPSKILRRRKQRFFVPLDTYFKGKFKERAIQTLEGAEVFDHFDSIEFTGPHKILNKMDSWRYKVIESRSDKSRMYYLRQLWNVLILELWYQTWLDMSA